MFTRDNYIIIPGFAVTELGLSGNELILYSLIYGFCQDMDTEFSGSLGYISEALNITRQNAKCVLDRLIGKGLIIKREIYTSGVKFCHYIVNSNSVIETATGCYRNSNGGVIETATNNSINNIDKYNKENSLIIESKRKFKVPTAEEVAEYCKGHGYQIDPEAFCDYYESKGWKVGSTPMKSWQAAVRTWVRRRQSPPPTPSPQYAIREDPMTRMLRRRGLVDEQGRLKSNITRGGCDEQ